MPKHKISDPKAPSWYIEKIFSTGIMKLIKVAEDEWNTIMENSWWESDRRCKKILKLGSKFTSNYEVFGVCFLQRLAVFTLKSSSAKCWLTGANIFRILQAKNRLLFSFSSSFSLYRLMWSQLNMSKFVALPLAQAKMLKGRMCFFKPL